MILVVPEGKSTRKVSMALAAGQFITSRPYPLPKTSEGMAAELWYNIWPRNEWPYRELHEGSTLYWYNTKAGAIIWQSQVRKVERFEYADKESIKRQLRQLFGGNIGFDTYFDKKATNSGYCVAYKVDSLSELQLPKPPGFRFPQLGWLRGSDDQAQVWLASLPAMDANDDDSYHPTGEDRRSIALQHVRQRQGQPAFRKKLIERYGPACMISGCAVIEVIEAAHIQPYKGDDDNDRHNGLLLRSDLHALFDSGLLAVEPETLKVHISDSLMATEYAKFNGAILRCVKGKPSDRALRIKWAEFDAH
jgi:hypothetical protein